MNKLMMLSLLLVAMQLSAQTDNKVVKTDPKINDLTHAELLALDH